MSIYSYLVGGNAGRSLETPDFVYLNSLILDSAVDVFQDVPRKVLSRRVQLLVEWRQFVDVAMVEVLYDLVGGSLQITEVDEQADVVQLLTPSIDLDLVIVTVQVLALPLITAQLMRRGEVSLDHDFEESRHGVIICEPASACANQQSGRTSAAPKVRPQFSQGQSPW